MRTSLVSIVTALVIATTGTAMASSRAIPVVNGQSAAMAETCINNSQPLDISSVSHRVEVRGLPTVSNGHSVAMAEAYEHINQPLDRHAHSSVAQVNVNHASPFGYHSHSPAMTDLFASTAQPVKTESGIQAEFDQTNNQLVMD